ncbi:MAG: TetR/AcrR family transcriptional regulator [Lachnospiraceae bacterium]|nr:TetR/AcrR family transcriptional regulator [Lachnospiraceae bacterium]
MKSGFGREKQNYYLRMANEEANRITRESLQTALIYLMNEKDYKEITITELTQKAGTSRTAFYRNYQSKEDIMMEIMMEFVQKLEEYKKEFTSFENPRDWFYGILKYVNENRKDFELLLKADLQDKTKQIFSFYSWVNKNERSFSLWTEEYKDNDVKHVYYRRAMDNTFWFVFWDWIGMGFSETPEEIADICASLYQALTNL